MLSFLRDESVADSSAQKANAAGTGAEEAKEQEYLTVKTPKKQVLKSTIVLVVLFGIGVLSVWFMIKKSTPQTASAESTGKEETQIEKAIARLTGVRAEMFNRMDEIVNKFYEFSDVKQIKVNELAKNPFKHDIFLSEVEEKSDIEESESDISAEMMIQQLQQQTRNMQLLSIMKTDQGNCCMIDDKILYEGDSIRGFEVYRIGTNFVKLVWAFEGDEADQENESESTEIILKLSE